MTIIVVAVRDNSGRALDYRKFDWPDCIALAKKFYANLLDDALFATKKRKPSVISTRIIVDD